MLSWPPATMMVAAPVCIAWVARATAFSPDPHNMLTPHAGTLYGIPADTLAWRAGF